MIRTVDQAVEQNRKFVEECFKVTQKLIKTEEELKECKAKLLELEPIAEIIRDRVDADETLQRLVLTCQEVTKKNQEIVELSERLKKVNHQLDAKTKQYEDAKKSNLEMLERLEAVQQPKQIEIDEARAKIAESEEKIRTLKFLLLTKDNLRHNMVRCEAFYQQEIYRRDQSLFKAQRQIKALSSEALEMFHVCKALKDENLALRYSPVQSVQDMQYNMTVENLKRDNTKLKTALHEAYINQLAGAFKILQASAIPPHQIDKIQHELSDLKDATNSNQVTSNIFPSEQNNS